MTLSMMIRAGRLRWGRLPYPATGFMRLSFADHGGYLCELHPLSLVPNDHRANCREYVLWWTEGKGAEIIKDSPFLRSLRKIKQPFSVVLNEEGEIAQ